MGSEQPGENPAGADADARIRLVSTLVHSENASATKQPLVLR